MTVLIVLAMVIIFLIVDYAIQLRHSKSMAHRPAVANLSISEFFLPEGVFVLPNHLWSLLLPSGQIKIGIDRLIAHVVGKADEIIMPKKGTIIKKGNPLLTIRQGEHALHFASPLEGTVTEINKALAENPQAMGKNVNQGWAISFRPKDLAAELQQWRIGEKARLWMKDELERMRQFFSNFASEHSLNYQFAQDGGILTHGVMQKMDGSVWQRFENEFLGVEPSSIGERKS